MKWPEPAVPTTDGPCASATARGMLLRTRDWPEIDTSAHGALNTAFSSAALILSGKQARLSARINECPRPLSPTLDNGMLLCRRFI